MLRLSTPPLAACSGGQQLRSAALNAAGRIPNGPAHLSRVGFISRTTQGPWTGGNPPHNSAFHTRLAPRSGAAAEGQGLRPEGTTAGSAGAPGGSPSPNWFQFSLLRPHPGLFRGAAPGRRMLSGKRCFFPSPTLRHQHHHHGSSDGHELTPEEERALEEDSAKSFQELKQRLREKNVDDATREAERITLLGLALNLGLTGSKMVTGVISQSTALIADSVHSLTDLISDIATYIAVTLSRKAPTAAFPYGLLNAEALSAFIVSLTLISTGGSLCYVSLQDLAHILGASGSQMSLFMAPSGVPPTEDSSTALGWVAQQGEALLSSHLSTPNSPDGEALSGAELEERRGFWVEQSMRAGIFLAFIGFALKEQLYWMTHRLAKRLNSPALEANAWHHRADGFASLVALVGISGRYVGFAALDPIAGALVSAYIVKIGWSLLVDSCRQLLDAAPRQGVRRQLQVQAERSVAEHLDSEVDFLLRSRLQGVFLAIELQVVLRPEDLSRCGIALENLPRTMDAISHAYFEALEDDETVQPKPRQQDVRVSFIGAETAATAAPGGEGKQSQPSEGEGEEQEPEQK